jgi:Rrf2 family cysteine metabolism transcriptional repressor
MRASAILERLARNIRSRPASPFSLEGNRTPCQKRAYNKRSSQKLANNPPNQIDKGIESEALGIMNISVKSEYALKALLDLAIQYLGAPPGTTQMAPIKIADIAKRQKIPQKFLELILAGLKQNGFVDSRRGAEGGYLLARAADAITVGEVLRAVESTKGGLRTGKDDPFTEVWRRVDEAVSGVLDQTTFGELARAWHTRQLEFVPSWDI